MRELARRHQQLTEQLDRITALLEQLVATTAPELIKQFGVVIAIVRLCYEKRTQDYIARRRAEGKSKREAIRCVKRYIAREIDKILRDNPHLAPT